MRRLLILSTVFALCIPALWAADKETKDTPKAAAARKKLKHKVTCDYSETRLAEAVEDIETQVPGLRFRIDVKGGVSMNQTLTYKGEDKPLDVALDEMFKKTDLGYIVISKPRDAYDGTIMIRKGKERGFPKGE